jgi:cytoskeletal protein RodZ
MESKKPNKVFDYLVVGFVVLMAFAIGFSVYAANTAKKKTTTKSTNTAVKPADNTPVATDPTQTTDQTNTTTDPASATPAPTPTPATPIDVSPAIVNPPTRHRGGGEDD